MAGELTTAEDLEDITSQLGSNMAAEKMIIQKGIAMENVYLTASRASELLLKVSGELVYALSGEPFEADIDTYHGRDAKLTLKGKMVKIDSSHSSSADLGYCVNIHPSKGNIILNVEGQYNFAKSAASFLAVPCLAVPGGLFFGELGMAVGMLGGILVVLDAFTSNKNFLKNYKNDSLFKNYAAFASEVSPEKAKRLLDVYLALPGSVYNAVEDVISRNKLLVGDLDARHKELGLLEEKLR